LLSREEVLWNMAARLELRGQVFEVKAGQTLYHALEKLGIAPQTVLPVRAGELITEDEILQDGETVKLVAVVSGGAG